MGNCRFRVRKIPDFEVYRVFNDVGGRYHDPYITSSDYAQSILNALYEYQRDNPNRHYCIGVVMKATHTGSSGTWDVTYRVVPASVSAEYLEAIPHEASYNGHSPFVVLNRDLLLDRWRVKKDG